MKRIFLLIFLLLLVQSTAFSQGNSVYFTGYTFYNSTTQQIQVSYWICNPSGGDPNIDIAAVSVTFEWNSAVTYVSSNFYPLGDGLDSSGNLGNPSVPDTTYALANTTHNGRTYQRTYFQRSTNKCSNVIHLGNGSCVPFFQATFSITADSAANYTFNTSSADPKFIASFDPTASNPNAPIQISPGTQLDAVGNSTSCKDANLKGNTITPSGGPYIVNTSNGPLPVKWLSFNVYKQNKNAFLQWETATELNNQGFEIQRKTNDKFEKIAFVSSKSENGNSSANLSYEFIDAGLPANSTIYYRVKQVGLDKSESYSEIKAIRNNVKNLQVLVYPNPNNGTANVILPGDIKNINVSLMDYSGKLLRIWNNLSSQTLVLKDMKKGFYLLQVNNPQTGELTTQKITVL